MSVFLLKLKPASVLAELILRDRVLDEVKKNTFIALSGNGGPQWATVLKTVCPKWGGGWGAVAVLRSMTVMVQRGRDKLVDSSDRLVVR